jgi:hypothetical protein
MKDGKDSGPHFSLVVAPVLAAFTLPTIALIVTVQPPLHFGNIILAFFVASTGLLLASFQLAVGRLFTDTDGWGTFRAFLADLGLIFLGIGLYFLVFSWNGKAERKVPYAGNRDFLYAGLAVLVAGIILPILFNLWLYAKDRFSTDKKDRHRAKAIDEKAEGAKREYSSKHPWAADFGQEFSEESEERLVRLKLMQAYPSAGDINYILKSICYSSSPFEQDQALRAAIRFIPWLRECDSARLAAAVQLLSLLND